MSTYERTEQETEKTNETEVEQTNEHAQTEETLTCPECSGQLKNEGAETVCTECGLVVEEDEIDRGPEWRAFDSAEKDKKSRVGAPTTKMMHDDGLSTNIGWQDKDAYGNSLSS
ncbi:MAG: TFIIB-type zinc ribbon-containing protein, partial [Natronomonas sp.]